jgi:hypothetical protein
MNKTVAIFVLLGVTTLPNIVYAADGGTIDVRPGLYSVNGQRIVPDGFKDGTDFVVLTNDNMKRRVNTQYTGIVTLDSPEDLGYRYYCVEIKIEGKSLYRQVFELKG